MDAMDEAARRRRRQRDAMTAAGGRVDSSALRVHAADVIENPIRYRGPGA
jgi:hypothetical protein